MIEFVFFAIAIAALGFIIGWWAREKYAMHVVSTIVKKAKEEYLEDVKSSVVNVLVEKANDVFYIYAKEDGTFLAQGKNIDELTDILNERFPGKMFNVTPEDLKMLEATK